MKSNLKRFISFVLALIIGLQPLGVVLAREQNAADGRRAELEAMANRMGVKPLFLSDPEAFLARESEWAEERRTAALKALERRYRPAPEALARVRATAESARDHHAYAAFLGLLNTLDALHRDASGRRLDAARTSAYHALISAGIEDLDRMLRVERARIGDSPLAVLRLARFAGQARQDVLRIADALAAPPDANAPAREWANYSASLEEILAPIAAADAPHRRIGPGLPGGRVFSEARRPAASRAAYLREVYGLGLFARVRHTARDVQAPFAAPVASELDETPDVHFIPEIDALVAQMDGDPVALFNYVHDRIDAEIYYGSKKGSTGTLYEAAGNDVDQASLLIALLRRAGIPARYATGRVWLNGQQAQDLTRTTDTQAAADVLTTGGIPAVYVIRSSGEPVVQMEHTWVQAWLPYESYRGVLEKPGHSAWIDLDPFVKRYIFDEPLVDLQGDVPFDVDNYLASGVTTTLPLDSWKNGARDYVKAHVPGPGGEGCATLASAARTRRILPDRLQLLPAELPVRVMQRLGTADEIPASQRYAITIELPGRYGTPEFSHHLLLPASYGQRIDLAFPAATAADQAIIDQHGGLYDTPPYLVNLRPTLRVSETVVAQGAPLHPGEARTLRVTFTTPGLSSLVPEIDHETNAGGVYVVGIDYQTIPQRLIDDAKEREAELLAAGDAESAEAQGLHMALLTYFREYDRGLNDATALLRHSYVRDVGAGFLTRQVRVREQWGSPVDVDLGGELIDVPKLTYTPFDEEAQQTAHMVEVTSIVGYHSSALEHHVLQQHYGKYAVSAVKGLQYASDQGQTLHTVTTAAQLAGLGVSSEVKDQIRDALNRGWHAKVPNGPINYFGWQGTGYVLYDPQNGAGAYLIEGGLSGGEVTGEQIGHVVPCKAGVSEPACVARREEIAANINAFLGQIKDIVKDALGPLGFLIDPVNLRNGNFVEMREDFLVPARAIPVKFERTYNSSRHDVDGRLGWGWSDSYNWKLVEQAGGTVDVTTGEGFTYHFAPDGSGGFVSPPGLEQATLLAVPAGYTLETAETLTFDADGNLTRIQSCCSIDALTLNYTGGGLNTIVDTTGRTALTFAYHPDGRLASITNPASESVRYDYDAEGNLWQVTGVDDKIWEYGYDAHHRLTSRTDPQGNTDTYAYDGEGRMYRHVNPLGEVESVVFDPYNDRVVVTGRDGNETITTFDTQGLPASFTDAQGNVTRVERDTAGRQLENENPRGFTASYGYDDPVSFRNVDGVSGSSRWDPATGTLTQTTTAGSETTDVSIDYGPDGKATAVHYPTHDETLTYDATGQVRSLTDSRIGYATAQVAYTADGLPETITATYRTADGTLASDEVVLDYAPGTPHISGMDAGDRHVTMTVNADGQPLDLYLNGTFLVSQRYDSLGNPTVITLTSGATSTQRYDALGRLVAREDTSGSYIFDYNAQDQITARTDARGQTWRYLYDELGRQTHVVRPDGSGESYGYCADEPQACAVVDVHGNTLQRELDALGRVVALTDTLGNTWRYLYDAGGRWRKIIDPEDHVTLYRYDAEGRLIEVQDALSQTTTYEYDAVGLRAIVDPRQKRHTFVYDEFGALVRKSDPLSNTHRYYHDVWGKTQQMIDANGTPIDYGYDGLGRLIHISAPGEAITYTRDPLALGGKVRAAETQYAHTTYDYSAHGFPTRRTQSVSTTTKSIVYTPTLQGNALAEVRNAEGQVTRYSYDAQGRPVAIAHEAAGTVTFAYDLAGRRVKMAYPNGATTYYTYDAAGQLTAQVTRNAAGEVLAAFHYTYDKVGNRTSLTDMNGRTTRYTYDPLYRLTDVAYGNGRTQHFEYDAFGNREKQIVAGQVITYTYDDANRLTHEYSAGQVITYTYDANGNLTHRMTPQGAYTYTYTAIGGRLVSIEEPGGSSWDFGYDGDGNRVYELRTHAGGAIERTDFLVDGNSVAADYHTNGAGFDVTHYLHGLFTDELLAQETEAGWVYFIQDPQGSVSVVLNAEGEIAARRSYDVFGAVLEEIGGWPGRYGYTGREDIGATGLMHYRARAYDPATGRFLSHDPMMGDQETPQTLNPYAYVQNNPINYTDPSGKSAQRFFRVFNFFDDSTVGECYAPYANTIRLAMILTAGMLAGKTIFLIQCVAINAIPTGVSFACYFSAALLTLIEVASWTVASYVVIAVDYASEFGEAAAFRGFMWLGFIAAPTAMLLDYLLYSVAATSGPIADGSARPLVLGVGTLLISISQGLKMRYGIMAAVSEHRFQADLDQWVIEAFEELVNDGLLAAAGMTQLHWGAFAVLLGTTMVDIFLLTPISCIVIPEWFFGSVRE